MRSRPLCYILASLAAAMALPAAAQAPSDSPPAGLTYADIADLVLTAPVVAIAEIDRATRIDPERAPGIPPGHVRYYVEAELQSMIRSSEAMPRTLRYLVDMPLDSRGRRPRIEGRTVLLMVAPVRGRPGEATLVARDSQVDWTAEIEQRARAILTEASAPGAPPPVTGIGNAFSVPGTLPGESETQIFLATSDGRPVSLGVLRRPGEQPRWNISLGEIVDSSLPPPQRDTLLWYRLACSLPDSLPPGAMEAGNEAMYRIAEADLRYIREQLGSCPRSRARR